MPKGDGTGPIGTGPRTGRFGGFCTVESVPRSYRPMYGQGYGFGSGRRAGRRTCRGWPRLEYDYGLPEGEMNRQQERDALADQAVYLEETLKNIKARVADLEGKK